MLAVIKYIADGKFELLEYSDSDACVHWALLRSTIGEYNIIVAERTYRDGVTVWKNPTEEELAKCRLDSWEAWNNEKGEWLE